MSVSPSVHNVSLGIRQVFMEHPIVLGRASSCKTYGVTLLSNGRTLALWHPVDLVAIPNNLSVTFKTAIWRAKASAASD